MHLPFADLSDRLPLLITGATGVAGYNAWHYFRRRYPGRVLAVRPRRTWQLVAEDVAVVDAEDGDALRELFAAHRFRSVLNAVGKTIVNSLIPFRGLVREISGAAPAERRLQAAVAAGIARRGYLRGLAGATKCRIAPIAPAVSPAAERPDQDKDGK